MIEGTFRSFFMFGLFYPNNYIHAIIISIFWEFVSLFYNENKSIDEIKQLVESVDYTVYKDLIIQLLAYYIGNKLRSVSPI